MKIANSITDLVGNTPLVKINRLTKGSTATAAVVPVRGGVPARRRLHLPAQRARPHRLHFGAPECAGPQHHRHHRHPRVPDAARVDPAAAAPVRERVAVRRDVAERRRPDPLAGAGAGAARHVAAAGPGRFRTGQAHRVPQGTDSRSAGACRDAAVTGDRRGSDGGSEVSQFVAANFVPLLFGGLLVFLLTGFPVAFSLAATGLAFGFIGMEIGLFPGTLFQALPLRVQGIMQNETLLAVPFFTLMGIILEKSGMAEDLLETVGQVFGPLRGGLALAVIFVGALLAATTGVVAAAVISMGLISLPIMLRYGYNRTLATGVITASGTLAQAIPPSLVLIVLADQLGRSVGDMYEGAILPALLLVACYAVYVILVSIFKPSWAPALPPEARIYRESNGASGHKSLLALLAIAAAAGFAWAQVHERVINPLVNRQLPAPGDEVLILSMTIASFTALALALLNPAVPPESRVQAVGAGDLRADPAAGADLSRPRHDLSRHRDADGGRRDGRRRRAADGGRPPPLVDVAAEAGPGEHDAAVLLRHVHPRRIDGLQLHLQRGRGPYLRRVAVQGHAGRGDRLPRHRQRPDLHPRLLHRLLRNRVHRDPAARACRRQDPPGTAAGRHARGLGPDLVRRHRGDEPADVVPHAALRFRTVLPAQRGATKRLSRSRHRQVDPRGSYRRKSTRVDWPSSRSSSSWS